MWSYKGIEHNNDFLQHRKYRKYDNIDVADEKTNNEKTNNEKTNNEKTKVQEESANVQKTKQVQSGFSFVKQYLSNQKKKRK